MRQAYTFQKNAAIQEIQRARSLRQSIVNHCNSIRTMRIEREEARARAEQERLEKQRIEGEREALLISFSELPDDVVVRIHLEYRSYRPNGTI